MLEDHSSPTATPRDWWQAARPHTWPNAFAPVIVGSGAAAYAGGFSWWRALLALIVAWALIVGVNYANDYSDGIRGTDEDRTGPTRLTGGRLAKPQRVKMAAFLAFGVAGVAGIALSLSSAWWLILVGALCIAGAWFYTGGKNPYGYQGLGEVAVFIFFGLVAVLGTEYTQSGSVSWIGLACAISIGAISSSVNLANNLRDIPTDTASGKITLAVRLGDRKTRYLYTVLALTPFVMSLVMAAELLPLLLAILALPLALSGVVLALRGARGMELIPLIKTTGQAMLMWAVITAVVLALNS